MPIRSVLMLEFNELTVALMDEFISARELPNFERLRSESLVAITDPGEPQDGLNPWVQWVTIHTGVPRSVHGVTRLGEGRSVAVPTIADVVDGAGLASWVCGSMNLPRGNRTHGAVLPDPWHPDPDPVPVELGSFDRLVRSMVQEHSNPDASVNLPMLVRFGSFMVRHGLTPATVRSGVTQLAQEARDRRRRWARSFVLDRLQWDVFRHYYKRLSPAFATFFSNSTAHLQHVYWREMQPEVFEVQPTAAEIAAYGDAVLEGYKAMDRLVGEAYELIGPDTAIVFCTGIGQQPYLVGEAIGGKRHYRPRDARALVARFDLDGVVDVVPIMSEQFRIRFRDDESARQGADRLRAATVAGRGAFDVAVADAELVVGCGILHEVPADATMDLGRGRDVAFHDAFYRLVDPKSGYHHPDGMLWIRHRDVPPGRVEDRVPLTSVAPTMLALLGLEAPPSMDTPALALGERAR